jgi:hypothetical protein
VFAQVAWQVVNDWNAIGVPSLTVVEGFTGIRGR